MISNTLLLMASMAGIDLTIKPERQPRTSFTGDPTPERRAQYDQERIDAAKKRREIRLEKYIANNRKADANNPTVRK